ncbi:MAG: hypothetical protein ABIJ96_09880 [Elusimicrobiota bacterium]
MNAMLAGFVTYGASEPLGLPDEYGLCCVIAGTIIITIAARLLPKTARVEDVARVAAQK